MRGSRILRTIDRYFGIPFCLLLSLFKRTPSSPISPSSILVIKLSAIGDTVLLVPSLRAIRRRFPKARISMVATNINSGLLDGCPYIDKIIHFDLKRPLLFLRLLRRIRAEVVFDFDQWLRISPIIAYVSGARERIGFRTAGQFRHYLYTKVVPREKKRHEVLCFLDILMAFGIEAEDHSLELWVKKRDRDTIQERLWVEGVREGDLLVGIHPGRGTHFASRRWREENFGFIADRLIQDYGARVVFTGTADDGVVVDRIISSMREDAINMAGKTSLGELFALLERFSLLLCINTGVMHIAAALKVKVVALHGPDDPSKWGPWGDGHTIIRAPIPCSPCSYLGFEYRCRKGLCMDMIKKEEVLSSIHKVLGGE